MPASLVLSSQKRYLHTRQAPRITPTKYHYFSQRGVPCSPSYPVYHAASNKPSSRRWSKFLIPMSTGYLMRTTRGPLKRMSRATSRHHLAQSASYTKPPFVFSSQRRAQSGAQPIPDALPPPSFPVDSTPKHLSR
ncbi:hypothetical protein DENSPDRAFT_879157 [Dentipellis sp. KUC8613]|nr:hypothetical protein DENSPDRAFT_879157 [Dentipellis sp. KUC8613]